MNAGMYGMADGRGIAGRKLIGRVGFQTTNSGAVVDVGFGSSGLAANAHATTAGVRTRLLSVSGRGALRWFGIAAGATGGSTYRVEIVVDGVTVMNTQYATASGRGPCVWGTAGQTVVDRGAAARPCPVLDYLPFDSSIEVYLTASISESTNGYFYAVDLHQ